MSEVLSQLFRMCDTSGQWLYFLMADKETTVYFEWFWLYCHTYRSFRVMHSIVWLCWLDSMLNHDTHTQVSNSQGNIGIHEWWAAVLRAPSAYAWGWLQCSLDVGCKWLCCLSLWYTQGNKGVPVRVLVPNRSRANYKWKWSPHPLGVGTLEWAEHMPAIM